VAKRTARTIEADHWGNGFTTYRCQAWQYMDAGPHVLNMRHLKYHEMFCILCMVPHAHSTYLDQLWVALTEFPAEWLVYN
jgi:hypothetical protein